MAKGNVPPWDIAQARAALRLGPITEERNTVAVSIRLRRTGARNNPHFRIVVADKRSPRDGRFIEQLGSYNPQASGINFKLDLERARYWLARGAQPTETVRALLKKAEKLAASQTA